MNPMKPVDLDAFKVFYKKAKAFYGPRFETNLDQEAEHCSIYTLYDVNEIIAQSVYRKPLDSTNGQPISGSKVEQSFLISESAITEIDSDLEFMVENGFIELVDTVPTDLLSCFRAMPEGDNTFAKYTSVGCYPLLYLDGENSVLCAACATKTLTDSIEKFRPVAVGPNYEDPSLFCDDCNERIESAYAEDEVESEVSDD